MKRLPNKFDYAKSPCLILNLDTQEIEVGFASQGKYWIYKRLRNKSIKRVELTYTCQILADVGLLVNAWVVQNDMRQELVKSIKKITKEKLELGL